MVCVRSVQRFDAGRERRRGLNQRGDVALLREDHVAPGPGRRRLALRQPQLQFRRARAERADERRRVRPSHRVRERGIRPDVGGAELGVELRRDDRRVSTSGTTAPIVMRLVRPYSMISGAVTIARVARRSEVAGGQAKLVRPERLECRPGLRRTDGTAAGPANPCRAPRHVVRARPGCRGTRPTASTREQRAPSAPPEDRTLHRAEDSSSIGATERCGMRADASSTALDRIRCRIDNRCLPRSRV